MSTNLKARAHGMVAELSAELRAEPQNSPERISSMEKWRRKSDEPARRSHANGILALRSYVRACGYDMAVIETIGVAIAAAGGADHEVSRPDWLMGLYLRGGTDAEADRIDTLPAHHQEKRTLGQAWKRAFEFLQAEQEHTGIISLRREHGKRSWKTGKNKSSKLHVLCAQDLAEIETGAKKIRAPRFQRYARAAAEQVVLIRRDPQRFTRVTPKPEPKPRREKGNSSPATRRVVFMEKLDMLTAELCGMFVEKLDKLTAEFLRDEIADGASEEEICELLAMGATRMKERLQEVLPSGPDDDPPLKTNTVSIKRSSKSENSPETLACKNAQSETANCEKGQQNEPSPQILVFKSEYQSTAEIRPPDDPDPASDNPELGAEDSANILFPDEISYPATGGETEIASGGSNAPAEKLKTRGARSQRCDLIGVGFRMRGPIEQTKKQRQDTRKRRRFRGQHILRKIARPSAHGPEGVRRDVTGK